MVNDNQEQQECQQIIDFLNGLYIERGHYQSLVATTPPLFAPDKQAHRLLAYFWIHRLHFPEPYRQWPPSARLLAMFEGKLDAYQDGMYDPLPFLQEHQRLLPRSLSGEHPYPWHLEEDGRLIQEAEEDRQTLDAWVRKQIGQARRQTDLRTVDEETHLSRILSQLNCIPFQWRDFHDFVRREWEEAEVHILRTDHPFIVAQHTVYKHLREQLATMGRLS